MTVGTTIIQELMNDKNLDSTQIVAALMKADSTLQDTVSLRNDPLISEKISLQKIHNHFMDVIHDHEDVTLISKGLSVSYPELRTEAEWNAL